MSGNLYNVSRRSWLIIIGIAAIYFFGTMAHDTYLNDQAKKTWLKDFYAQAALSERHMDEVRFADFVLREPIDRTQKASGRRNRQSNIQYCSRQHSVNEDRECSKGVAQYYRIPDITAARIAESDTDMQALGWQNSGSDSPEEIENYILNANNSDIGYYYTRSDGSAARLSFLNGSHAFPAGERWCVSEKICKQLSEKAPGQKYFMRVEMSAAYSYDSE